MSNFKALELETRLKKNTQKAHSESKFEVNRSRLQALLRKHLAEFRSLNSEAPCTVAS